jgi:DNA (cytosine-5)-methyltransferase 1
VLPSLLQHQHPTGQCILVLIDAMDPRPPRTSISVCSGVGGLDLGLARACGVEPVVYIERDAFAASVLVARMEEKALASAPIWDDLDTFDARPWCGLVDLVAGGTPCQDLSTAGGRGGLNGERSRLFFQHVRVAVECDAPFFFWENVAGAVGVIPAVADHLHANGYDSIAWTTVRASDVGAPHKRERVFLLAHSPRLGRIEWRAEPEREPRRPDAAECGRGLHEAVLPGPDAVGEWRTLLEHRPDLAPAAPQPWLRRDPNGLGGGLDASLRADRLRACGNGVHPGQATLAWRVLWGAMTGIPGL